MHQKASFVQGKISLPRAPSLMKIATDNGLLWVHCYTAQNCRLLGIVVGSLIVLQDRENQYVCVEKDQSPFSKKSIDLQWGATREPASGERGVQMELSHGSSDKM